MRVLHEVAFLKLILSLPGSRSSLMLESGLLRNQLCSLELRETLVSS